MTSPVLPHPATHRRASLHRRLPLAVSLVLIATVGALGWAAYREVKEAVLQGATARVQSAARQLASLLSQSMVQRMEEGRRLAARPVFRQALDLGDEAVLGEVHRQLEAQLASSPQLLSVVLWRGSAERLVSVRATNAAAGPALPAEYPDEPPQAAGFRPLQAAGDLLYSELTVSIPPAAPAVPGSPVKTGKDGVATGKDGYLVFRRRATASTGAATIARLMGDGVSLRVGSRNGGIWTDLLARVAAPPAGPPTDTLAAYRGLDGRASLGTEAALAGAPWSVWVEIQEATALTPVRAFWQRLLRVGGAIVVVGTLLAWVISRRITAPLHALTSAAEAIADGQLSKRVQADRQDEVGRLGDAFNRMADRVQEGYARLDSGIRERTRELEETVEALRDAQEQLVRREKLAILGQLASGVGHELRNPLGVMTNAVYYLEIVQTAAAPEIVEYHGILRAQIGLAEKSVCDLLDFARIKPPRRERVVLAELVGDQLARLTIPASVTIDCDVPLDLPHADVDRVQVGQVVFNLLVNAVQAIDECVGTVLIRASASDGHVVLSVQDTGPGVLAEHRTKIFEPLFTTKARGIGLGLAVSRSLAEANGGALTLSEAPEGGARFTLTMPDATSLKAVA